MTQHSKKASDDLKPNEIEDRRRLLELAQGKEVAV